MTYTPGPWEVFIGSDDPNERPGVDAADVSIVVYGDKWDEQGICGRNGSPSEALANAHLISAAPDLLEALQLHVAYEATPTDRGGSQGPKGRAWRAFVEARDKAIAKAIAKAMGT